MDRDEFYTAVEAAKVLGISDRRVRKLASEGRIEGERTDDGWMLFRRSVHEFRDMKRAREAPTMMPEWPIEVREALDEVKNLTFRLGRMEGRLELEAITRSTLEQQLQREQDRADQERKRADAERQRVEVLETELREARRSWWQRMFTR
jgi:excisionase family DNA binding protein